jgi:hypothetical protein
VTRGLRAWAGCVAAFAVLALAACGETTRTATLNNATHVTGASMASALQQELAKRGYPNAAVSCAKSIIVYIGPAVSCAVTGAGPHHTVHFTFKTLDGKISVSSVKAS